jgi:hypothetical protein
LKSKVLVSFTKVFSQESGLGECSLKNNSKKEKREKKREIGKNMN